jgi:hypothetical protein
MFSMKFEHLMRDFPLEEDAIQRLSDYFQESAEKKRTLSLSFDRLFDIANPSSTASLAQILQELIEDEVLVEVFRVESEPGVGSDDYLSLQDIPEIVSDRNGLELIPDLYNTKTYYKFQG